MNNQEKFIDQLEIKIENIEKDFESLMNKTIQDFQQNFSWNSEQLWRLDFQKNSFKFILEWMLDENVENVINDILDMINNKIEYHNISSSTNQLNNLTTIWELKELKLIRDFVKNFI